jgi:hypothetical protein
MRSTLGRRRACAITFCAFAGLLGIGCAEEKKPDYGPYLSHMPKSVLVLPPLNESTHVTAPEAFLSTITAPLAERGYYVFPVAITDRYMKENGLPTPGEMHQVPPKKFREVFDADAVLYITIKSWTSTYVVIDSTTSVTLEYRLLDTTTSTELWHQVQTVQDSSSQGQSDIFSAMILAGIHAATNVDEHRERALAAVANAQIIHDPKHGMLVGLHHPGFDEDQKKHQTELASAQAGKSAPAAVTAR